jgi:membrane protein implicated in regulation of membrane protease activity
MVKSNIWWLLTVAAVALELLSGTFYLLMFAVGFSAGAVAAYFHFDLIGQIVAAATVGGGSVALWHWRRLRKPVAPPANANRDVLIDIGESVHVEAWSADGTALVKFRGAQWSAVPARPEDAQSLGNFRIKEMRGNRLVIEKL